MELSRLVDGLRVSFLPFFGRVSGSLDSRYYKSLKYLEFCLEGKGVCFLGNKR